MPQEQDLDLLLPLRAEPQHDKLQQPPQRPVHEQEDHTPGVNRAVPARRFPRPAAARDCLRASSYSETEIERSGVLADSRWPGRLCGAWRDERGRIKTMWARSLDNSDGDVRYLYGRQD